MEIQLFAGFPSGLARHADRKYLYVGDFEGAAKIGVSADPLKRLQTLSLSSGRQMNRCAVAGPFYKATVVEAELLFSFQSERLVGSEWVSATFEQVLAEAQMYVVPRCCLEPKATDPEREARAEAFFARLFPSSAGLAAAQHTEGLRAYGPGLVIGVMAVGFRKVLDFLGERGLLSEDMDDQDIELLHEEFATSLAYDPASLERAKVCVEAWIDYIPVIARQQSSDRPQ
jgi:hypothetical protein